MYNQTNRNMGVSDTNAVFDQERLYFNKWEMYKLLAPHSFPFQMPYTKFLSDQALELFAYEEKPYFIKPVGTWAGKNITLIKPSFNGYILQYPNGSGDVVPNLQVLKQSLYQQYQNTPAIIQQHAPILSIDSRPFDIRVHLQRNGDGRWLYAGDLVRVGGNGSIVSNLFAKGGGVVETNATLENLFSYYDVVTIKEKLAQSSLGIAYLLDRYYPFIDIGADFGVDLHGDLWLLEVNTNDKYGRPGYDLFKKLPDKTIYKQMKKKDKERQKVWKMNGLLG